MLHTVTTQQIDNAMNPANSILRSPPMHNELRTTIYNHLQWADVRHLWLLLVTTSPYASFFLSCEWVESWLEFYGDLLKPQILIFTDEGNTVGACLLVERTIFRGPVPVRCIFLNTAGEDEIEETCADFNNLLCLEGCEEAMAMALWAHLEQRNPDEISATGFAMGRPLDALAGAFNGRTQLERIERSFYVDLAQLRNDNCLYLMALRQSARTNVRRAYRKYGTVELTAAENISDALDMFEELVDLHQRTWNSRGRPGSFASRRTLGFIQCLIRRGLPTGAVLILRVKSGSQTIGILLQFVFRRKVNYYAGGLCYREDPQFSPGIVSLVAGINYCLERGFDEVDFLAGESEYKKQLSTGSRNLSWTVFQKPSAKMQLIRIVQGIKRRTFRQMEKH